MAISVPIAGSSPRDIYNVIQQTDGTYTSLQGTPSYISPVRGGFYNEGGSRAVTVGNYKGIILGTGTTPSTYSDYKMENYNTGLTYSNETASWSAPNVILTESATNGTDANIIVSEVGVFGMDSPDGSFKKTLYTRSLIEPVTIKPNETKTFTVKINFDKFSEAYSAI